MNSTLRYYQIDFLRLFRLARSLGAVNRKRNMPINYTNSRESLNACSRLFKTFLAKLFNGLEIESSTRYNRYRIIRSYESELHHAISFFNEYATDIRNNYADIYSKYATLYDEVDEFIIPHNHSITVNVIRTNSRYGRLVRSNVHTTRPKAEFYFAAKSAIKYKALCDEIIPDIIDFFKIKKDEIVNTHNTRLQLARERRLERQREIEEAAREAREAERIREAREATMMEQRMQRAEDERIQREASLRNRIQQATTNRRQTNQAAFNDALIRWREDR